MYDLRIVVDEVKGFCDMPMRPGDYFEVRGSRLIIPEGKSICIWALQSLMPMLPLKQRETNEDNDWVPNTHKMVCPDPNGLVIYRIERIPVGAASAEASRAKAIATGTGAATSAATATGSATASAATEPIPARLLADPKLCSGCRSCELACSLHHTGSFAPELARLRVEKVEEEGIDRPVVCHQCGNAPCVKACRKGALTRHPATRALVLDATICTGCGVCVNACSFGALRMHAYSSHETGASPGADASSGADVEKPLPCDLCGGDPECVKRCATGALKFGRAGSR